MSRGYSLAAVCEVFIAGVSRCGTQALGLVGLWASVVGFSRAQALDLWCQGLIAQ